MGKTDYFEVFPYGWNPALGFRTKEVNYSPIIILFVNIILMKLVAPFFIFVRVLHSLIGHKGNYAQEGLDFKKNKAHSI